MMAQKSATPTMKPPGARNGKTAEVSAPSIPDAATAGVVESAPAGPTLQPPGVAGGTAGGTMTAVGAPSMAALAPSPAVAAAGTWQTGVTVDALWSINQVRNAYMRVVGVGWVKIYNGTDGAFTALVTLASQARQTGRPISYRQEADGMAHEIYLW